LPAAGRGSIPLVGAAHGGPPPEGEPARQADPREREVLALIAEGHSNHGIAEELVVTLAAVERHVTSISAKLSLYPEKQAHRRVLAVLRYLDR
jgi:DNA-binding NarL/FixJ family response regulator